MLKLKGQKINQLYVELFVYYALNVAGFLEKKIKRHKKAHLKKKN